MWNKSGLFLSCTLLFTPTIPSSNTPHLSWMKTLTPGRHIPRSWREQADPWHSDAREPWHGWQDAGKERTPFPVTTALPLLSRLYQSSPDADSFVLTPTHHSTNLLQLSRTTIQIPVPDSQGQMALSGETYSRTKKKKDCFSWIP